MHRQLEVAGPGLEGGQVADLRPHAALCWLRNDCIILPAQRTRILVGAGLVAAEKRGQKVYYECVTEGPGEVIRYLERYRQPAGRPGD